MAGPSNVRGIGFHSIWIILVRLKLRKIWQGERKTKDRKTLVTLERLHEPSRWVTLNCYRVLAKTGDLDLPN